MRSKKKFLDTQDTSEVVQNVAYATVITCYFVKDLNKFSLATKKSVTIQDILYFNCTPCINYVH